MKSKTSLAANKMGMKHSMKTLTLYRDLMIKLLRKVMRKKAVMVKNVVIYISWIE